MRLEFEPNAATLPTTEVQAVTPKLSSDLEKLLRDGVKAAQDGKRAEARTLLLRVTEGDADNENAWLWLASISEYPEELLVFLNNVLRVNPTNERALEWHRATRSLLAKTLVQRGIDAIRDERAEFARQCFEQAIDHEADSELAWLWLASVADEHEKADLFTKVLEINPENETAKSSLDAINLAKNNALFEESLKAAIDGNHIFAYEALTTITNRDETYVDAWVLKAHIAPNFEDRADAFLKLREVAPDNEFARVALASWGELAARVPREVVETEEVSEVAEVTEEAESSDLVTALDQESMAPVETAPTESDSPEPTAEQVEAAVAATEESFSAEFSDYPQTVELSDFYPTTEESATDFPASESFAAAPAEETEAIHSSFADVQAELELIPEVENDFLPHAEIAEEESQTAASQPQEFLDEEPVLSVETTEMDEFVSELLAEADDRERHHADSDGGAAVAVADAPEEFAEDFVDEALTAGDVALEADASDELELVATAEAREEAEFFLNLEEEMADHSFEDDSPVFESAGESALVETSLESLVDEAEAITLSNTAEALEESAEMAAQSDEVVARTDGDVDIFKPIEEVVIEQPKAEASAFRADVTLCPFCVAENDPKAFVCVSCQAVLTLSDLEMLLSPHGLEEEKIKQSVLSMEAENESYGLGADQLRDLGIGHINLKNYRQGYHFLQEAVRTNPNNVILEAQVNALAIRLAEIEAQQTASDQLVKNRKILVVDDSPTVRKLISGKLEKSGHEVICAVDGVDALQKISEVVPDLILLDITMPRMDGYQVCKMIRSNEETKDVPVVMISGKDGFFDKVRGKMAGTSGYITKPFGPETLMKTVETYLG